MFQVGGYRDVMLCVVYQDESGLSIIGEIQVSEKLPSLSVQYYNLQICFVPCLHVPAVSKFSRMCCVNLAPDVDFSGSRQKYLRLEAYGTVKNFNSISDEVQRNCLVRPCQIH